jgi:hypothetical protein
VLIRDTPQSCGLPTIERWRDDYPKNYSEKQEEVLTTREIFFKYVLNNKMLWFIAIANAFVYMVRYGCLDWAPTYLKEAQGYDIKEAGWAYFAATQYMLGIRPDFDGITVDPCIPADWKEFSVSRKWRGAEYHIHVTNPDAVEKGVKSITMNGRQVRKLPVLPVEVVMG